MTRSKQTIQACRQHRDDEMTIHWCAQLINLCRENGDETEPPRQRLYEY